LHGNTFEVDAVLVGRRVEFLFDPFDLAEVEARHQDRRMGQGTSWAATPPPRKARPGTGRLRGHTQAR